MKKFIHLIAALMLVSAFAEAQELNGDLTQGGMVIGTAEPGSKIWLDDAEIKVSTEGHFVFGFGRDQTGTLLLRMQTLAGDINEKTLTISPREYDIDYVNGLPPKTVTPPASWTARRKVETGRVRSGRSFKTDDMHWLSGFIKPAQGRISGVYGSQRVLNNKPRSPHYGLDIANDVGTDIVSPSAGVVRLAASDFLLEGGIVIIDHGHGVTSTLFHMNSVDVDEGQVVKQGEKIGTIGMTGRANGPHVDWRVNWKSVRLDPGLLVD